MRSGGGWSGHPLSFSSKSKSRWPSGKVVLMTTTTTYDDVTAEFVRTSLVLKSHPLIFGTIVDDRQKENSSCIITTYIRRRQHDHPSCILTSTTQILSGNKQWIQGFFLIWSTSIFEGYTRNLHIMRCNSTTANELLSPVTMPCNQLASMAWESHNPKIY